MAADPIFTELRFRNLTVKNRVLRSSISGRIDNYDGSGTQARINWERRFARGGVGAIISSHVPVHVRGRILPNYAFIDSDERIPFWRRVGEAVHAFDCKFIVQLSHAGRQQDIAGVENFGRHSLSASDRVEQFHGFTPDTMTLGDIKVVIRLFADGARRARQAGLDGVELHAGNGYLFTQFLSSAINDRKDEYGGPLENRARLLLEVIAAIRKEVGADFFLGVKFNAADYHDAVTFWEGPGNTLADGVRVARWLEAAGADALHVTTGSMFPHPRNPPGGFPLDVAEQVYPSVLGEGVHTFRNYLLFRYRALRPIARHLWNRTRGPVIEGINVPEARAIKAAVSIPVLVTGGFQRASYIREVLADGACDAVTIARPLIANPDLLEVWRRGDDAPERPCTYCNKCLIHVLEHPLGCYEESRYPSRAAMIRDIMAVFEDEPASVNLPPELEHSGPLQRSTVPVHLPLARASGPTRATEDPAADEVPLADEVSRH